MWLYVIEVGADGRSAMQSAHPMIKNKLNKKKIVDGISVQERHIFARIYLTFFARHGLIRFFKR